MLSAAARVVDAPPMRRKQSRRDRKLLAAGARRNFLQEQRSRVSARFGASPTALEDDNRWLGPSTGHNVPNQPGSSPSEATSARSRRAGPRGPARRAAHPHRGVAGDNLAAQTSRVSSTSFNSPRSMGGATPRSGGSSTPRNRHSRSRSPTVRDSQHNIRRQRLPSPTMSSDTDANQRSATTVGSVAQPLQAMRVNLAHPAPIPPSAEELRVAASKHTVVGHMSRRHRIATSSVRVDSLPHAGSSEETPAATGVERSFHDDGDNDEVSSDDELRDLQMGPNPDKGPTPAVRALLAQGQRQQSRQPGAQSFAALLGLPPDEAGLAHGGDAADSRVLQRSHTLPLVENDEGTPRRGNLSARLPVSPMIGGHKARASPRLRNSPVHIVRVEPGPNLMKALPRTTDAEPSPRLGYKSRAGQGDGKAVFRRGGRQRQGSIAKLGRGMQRDARGLSPGVSNCAGERDLAQTLADLNSQVSSLTLALEAARVSARTDL